MEQVDSWGWPCCWSRDQQSATLYRTVIGLFHSWNKLIMADCRQCITTMLVFTVYFSRGYIYVFIKIEHFIHIFWSIQCRICSKITSVSLVDLFSSVQHKTFIFEEYHGHFFPCKVSYKWSIWLLGHCCGAFVSFMKLQRSSHHFSYVEKSNQHNIQNFYLCLIEEMKSWWFEST